MSRQVSWENFWENYRKINYNKYEDLFFQVGKTINQQPISKEMFELMIEGIVKELELHHEDTLLELCCGNGLVTKPLSRFVKRIYAFDFTKHLIKTATQYNSMENIVYGVGNAKSDFLKLFNFASQPSKFLMNDSLGYFTSTELQTIVSSIKKYSPSFLFYITGIPCDELKWNFYNTPERKEMYLDGLKAGDETNKGIGRWWKKAELEIIAQNLNIEVHLSDQEPVISNYRINALFRVS